MIDHFASQQALKQKIRNGEPTLGLFVKTPSIHIVELLAAVNVDCIVFDCEHAAFGIETLDHCLLAARAAGIHALVRVDSAQSRLLQCALDMGAAGVIVPHIRSAKQARQAVAATRFRQGTRGFSASHRAASYADVAALTFCKHSDQSTIIIGQIEDAEAINCIDEIAQTDAMDALFIGCADLSISLNVDDFNDAAVQQAVDTVCIACQKEQRSTGIFLPSLEDIEQYRQKSISLYFISSDQALLKKAAIELVTDFGNATT